jgi:hypothetical protein
MMGAILFGVLMLAIPAITWSNPEDPVRQGPKEPEGLHVPPKIVDTDF